MRMHSYLRVSPVRGTSEWRIVSQTLISTCLAATSRAKVTSRSLASQMNPSHYSDPMVSLVLFLCISADVQFRKSSELLFSCSKSLITFGICLMLLNSLSFCCWFYVYDGFFPCIMFRFCERSYTRELGNIFQY